MGFARVSLWLLTFCLLASTALGQDALAKQLRTQALDLRTEVTHLREQAGQSKSEADKQRQAADDARAKAKEARSKGDNSAGESFESQARDAANKAQELDGLAEEQRHKADSKEQLASDKEAEARKIEAAGNSAADQLYRKLREVGEKAEGDLADLKQAQKAFRVGRETMGVRWALDHVHDEELKPFTERDLNAQFLEWEDSIHIPVAGIETDRDEFAAGKKTADQYADAAYSRMKSIAIELEPAMFKMTSAGYDTLEAELYKLERPLHEELASAKEQLRNANISDAAKKAFLDALIARQNEDRRKLFMQLGPQYRAMRNRIAMYVQDWVALLKECHDLAVSLSKGDDIHRAGANWIEDAMTYFSLQRVALPMSLAMFMDVPGSIDRFNHVMGEYDWCKARPFPDIQPEDDPGQFRMFNLLDKLPLLSKGGKVDGAARTIGP
jgi:hypothetical protein